MSIASGNKATVSTDGVSAWVRIPARQDNQYPMLVVGNPDNNWGGSTAAAVEICPDATIGNPIPAPLRESDNTTAVSFSSNDYRVLENVQGFARISVTDYVGSDDLTIQIV